MNADEIKAKFAAARNASTVAVDEQILKATASRVVELEERMEALARTLVAKEEEVRRVNEQTQRQMSLLTEQLNAVGRLPLAFESTVGQVVERVSSQVANNTKKIVAAILSENAALFEAQIKAHAHELKMAVRFKDWLFNFFTLSLVLLVAVGSAVFFYVNEERERRVEQRVVEQAVALRNPQTLPPLSGKQKRR